MHTALVTKWGEIPKYLEVDTPPVPSADSDTIQVKLVASGVHQVVRSRAEGTHYSARTLPHVPGVDGVATTSEGKYVYFSTLATGGSMSEFINVPKKDTRPLPEGLDPVQVAALLNPAMSSWMAMQTRTSNLPKNFTVLIMGATTISGTIAISLVRSLGAAKVIGVARNIAALETLGLDETIQLTEPAEKTDFSKLGDVDVILDYLWGPPTVHLFNQLASKIPVQYVQIGSMAGLEANLASANLRSKNITVRGAGPGSWTFPQLVGEYGNILNALKSVKKQEVNVVKLADIEKVWNEKSATRTVFVP
ncbi:quinone oxidoreductase [Stipitochalara longipes BDJ]|nr:quinone oxidoreductase [Stipitochalara longipes BDJ]